MPAEPAMRCASLIPRCSSTLTIISVSQQVMLVSNGSVMTDHRLRGYDL